MRCVDCICLSTMTPEQAVDAIEAAVPGLRVSYRGGAQASVDGYVNTSRLRDGSLYVTVRLFNNTCAIPNSPTGHSVPLTVAPPLTPVHMAALAAALEDNTQVLTPGTADAILATLRFGS